MCLRTSWLSRSPGGQTKLKLIQDLKVRLKAGTVEV